MPDGIATEPVFFTVIVHVNRSPVRTDVPEPPTLVKPSWPLGRETRTDLPTDAACAVFVMVQVTFWPGASLIWFGLVKVPPPVHTHVVPAV